MKQIPSENKNTNKERLYALSGMGLFALFGVTYMSIDSREMGEILLMIGITSVLTVLVLLVIEGKPHA